MHGHGHEAECADHLGVAGRVEAGHVRDSTLQHPVDVRAVDVHLSEENIAMDILCIFFHCYLLLLLLFEY